MTLMKISLTLKWPWHLTFNWIWPWQILHNILLGVRTTPRSVPFILTTTTALPVPFIPLTIPCYPHLQKNHTLCWYPSTLFPCPKNHTLCWYPSSIWPHPGTPSQQEPHHLSARFIPITLPITPSAEESHHVTVPFIPLTSPCYSSPTRTTPFARTLHPYYPIPRRTTPFVGTIRPSNLALLLHPLPHKNHTFAGTLHPSHHTHLWPPHQYPSSLLTRPSMCVCVIGGVLYDRIEVISLVKFHLTGSSMLYSMYMYRYCNEKWPVHTCAQVTSAMFGIMTLTLPYRTVIVVVDLVLLYFWLLQLFWPMCGFH